MVQKKPTKKTTNDILPNILIVDDGLDNLKLLSTILEKEGYSVRPAVSGKIALESIKIKTPDLILLDIQMPNMDGIEVCQKLKADKKYFNIPIIFISGLTEMSDKLRAFQAGGVDFITKPFQPAEVIARVKTHLNIVKMQGEILEHNKKLNETLTKLKETQSQLIHSEKMASLGKLTASIAHEINNPINFISSGIIALKEDFLELNKLVELIPEKFQEADIKKVISNFNRTKKEIEFGELKDELFMLFKNIEEGVVRAADIVRGLRNFASEKKVGFERSSIHSGIDTSLTILRDKLNKKGIEVIKNYGKIPPIMCNLQQLSQVFLNILSNAADSIVSDGIITITTEKIKGQIRIKISDNGKGMDKETKAKIFEPFFTTKDIGKGMGLGMSISYGIIKNHNGTIEVESKLGKGTAFTIILNKDLKNDPN